MSTIKQIAYLAGVSRGTVDRVLNNRGSVNPETAQKIREIAKAVNYKPSKPGRTLAVKKKQLHFGFVLLENTTTNPFFAEVVEGIDTKTAELQEYGITVDTRFAQIDDAQLLVQHMNDLVENGAGGLAVTPINHPIVVEAVNRFVDHGIPVITVNSDLPGSRRLAYVGSNYYQSGQTAAGLLALVTGGSGSVGIVSGSPAVLCHSERCKGFTEKLKSEYPGLRIAHTCYNNDDDLESYTATLQMLRNNPHIDALYLAAAGVYGVGRAVKDLELVHKIKIICHDTTESTLQLLKEGVVAATIAQQPFVQGSKPLELLLDCLGMDTLPENEYYYTNIEIKIKENI